MNTDRLRRSSHERIIFGVAGGLAEYWDVDPVLIRAGFVVLAFVSGGLGLLLYIALAIIMPKDGEVPEGDPRPVDEEVARRRRNLLGIVLIGLGVALLLGNLGPWFDWRIVLPVVLIAIGVLIIIDRMRRG